MNRNLCLSLALLSFASLNSNLAYAVMNDISSTEQISDSRQNNVTTKSSTLKYEVTTSSLNVRKSSSTSSSVIGKVKKGSKLDVYSVSNGWAKIKYGSNIGYVSSKYIKKVSVPSNVAGKYTVNTDDLNIRKSASSSSTILGKLNTGDTVEVLSISGSWAKIKRGSGFGYIHKNYIVKNNDNIGQPPKPDTPDESKPENPDKPSDGNISNTTKYKVNTDSLNVRSKGSTSGTVLGKLKKGAYVEVYSVSGDWAKIKYNNGFGYVHKKYITKVSSGGDSTSKPNPSYIGTYVSTTNNLNVRSSASSSGKILGKLSSGSTIKAYSVSNGWVKVDYKGKTAYVSSDYLVKLLSSTEANSITVLVNKSNSLGSNFTPSDMVTAKVAYCSGIASSTRMLKKEAASALEKMFNAAKNDRITLKLRSGYRSYSTQKQLYESKVSSMGATAANKVSARPGQSEHQTGLSVDILSSDYSNLNEGFANTKAFKWLEKNAHNYGFIIRYPKNKTNITGYNYEPWHFRYVGVEHATKIKKLGITFEEYSSKYFA